MAKCKCKTKEGNRCSRNAVTNSIYCAQHSNCIKTKNKKVVQSKSLKIKNSQKKTVLKNVVGTARKCNCKTKEGKRCSRSATEGYIYCKQHLDCNENRPKINTYKKDKILLKNTKNDVQKNEALEYLKKFDLPIQNLKTGAIDPPLENNILKNRFYLFACGSGVNEFVRYWFLYPDDVVIILFKDSMVSKSIKVKELYNYPENSYFVMSVEDKKSRKNIPVRYIINDKSQLQKFLSQSRVVLDSAKFEDIAAFLKKDGVVYGVIRDNVLDEILDS